MAIIRLIILECHLQAEKSKEAKEYLAAYNTSHAEAESSSKQMGVQIAHLESELAETAAKLAECGVNAETLAAVRDEMGECKKQCQVLETEQESNRSQLQDQVAVVAEKTEALAHAHKDLTSARADLRTLETQAAVWKDEAAEASASAAALSSEVEVLHKDHAATKHSLAAALEAAEIAKHSIVERQAKVDALEQTHQVAVAALKEEVEAAVTNAVSLTPSFIHPLPRTGLGV